MEETKVIEEVTEEVTENTLTTGAEAETEEKTETKTEEKVEEKTEEKTEQKTTETTEIPEGPEAVLSDGLPIMAAGMMGIFVVIGIIIVTISILAKFGGSEGYFAKGVKALFKKN